MKKLAEFFNRILNNNVVFIIMFTIYPVSFFMSANPFNYFQSQYLAAILILLFIALVASVAIESMFYIFKINRFFSSRTKRIMYLIFACPIVLEPMRKATYILMPSIIVFAVVGIILLSFAIYLGEKRAKVINTLVLVLTLTCLIIYAAAVFEEKSRDQLFSSVLDTPQEIMELQFVSRPNVYYFFLESYHGREAITELFKYDDDSFYNFLHKNKFRVYNNTYSNYSYTVASLMSTFQMRHNYHFLKRDSMKNSISAKEIIGGKKSNYALNAFRNNGYDINFFLLEDWTIPQDVRLTNVKLNPFSVLNYLYEKCFLLLNWKLTYTIDPTIILDDFQVKIKESPVSSSPQFYFIESGLMHVPHFSILPPEILKNTSWPEFDDSPYKFLDFFEELYVDKLKSFNVSFMKALEQIITDDPGAVIIILGDHGSNKYYNIDRKGVNNMLSVMRDAGISNRDFANSMFNVLLAVRMPPDLILPDAEVMSNVNVFRYVLSALYGTTSLIDNKEEDVSLTSYVISVRNGKPLEYPEHFDLEEYQRKNEK